MLLIVVCKKKASNGFVFFENCLIFPSNYRLMSVFSFLNFRTKTIFFGVLSCVLVCLTLLVSSSGALNFLISGNERLMASLAMVTELKIATNTGAGSHIPFVSGLAVSINDSLEKIFEYLILSNALVTSQIIILNLSSSLLIKVVSVIFIGGLFIKKTSSASLKALLVCLMLNPGVWLYVSVLNVISQESKLDLGVSLHQELQKTHEQYKVKEAERKEKQKKRDQDQLNKAETDGRDKIGLIHRVEDGVEDAVSDVSHVIGEDFKYSLDIIRASGKKLVQLVVNTMVAIIIIFLVLPVAYFYLVNLALKRLFNFQINRQTLQGTVTALNQEWNGAIETKQKTDQP